VELTKSVAWSGPVVGTVTYDYDTFLRPTMTKVNGADAADLGYDLDGLLVQAGTLTLTRNSQHGLITGTTLGAVSDTRAYNGFGEVDSYAATKSGNPALAITYTRDALGRIVQKDESVLGGTTHTTVYGYDLRGRLETVTTDGATVAYTYDDNGNRLARQPPTGPAETGTYDAQDRLLTYAGATYTYTANGELESKTVGTQVTQYAYDPLGNLRSVILPNGTLIEYVIDPANRRVGKKVNGTLTQGFLYEDQLRTAAELDDVGNVVSRFVYGTRINVPEYLVKGGVSYRLVTDHLGSPRLVVNTSDGSIVQRLDYDEFGRVTMDTAPGFQPFGFAGGLYDRDTGLVRFGARDYDAATGRWTVKDPIRFDGLSPNLFGYATFDPINALDPFGLRAYSCDKVQRILANVRVNASRGALPRRLWNVGTAHCRFCRYDFKWKRPLDTFVMGKTQWRADEFGNFVAGYAGEYAAGDAGYWLVRAAGAGIDAYDNSGLDQDSVPDIDAGAAAASAEIDASQ